MYRRFHWIAFLLCWLFVLGQKGNAKKRTLKNLAQLHCRYFNYGLGFETTFCDVASNCVPVHLSKKC